MARRHGAAAIILDQDKVLLVKQYPWGKQGGHWNFPGGLVDPGETFEQAAIRETLEETDIFFTPQRLFWRGSNAGRDVEIFIGTGTGEVKHQRFEVADARWFTIEEAKKLPLAYNGLELLNQLDKSSL